MKQSFFTIIFSIILFSLSSGVAFAAYTNDTNCQPIYGGGETCEPGVNISIDKKVVNPATGQEVDNLSINDPKFKPGQEIRFNIYVTNTGTDELDDIAITDTMAEFTTFTSSNINFDIDGRTLTSEIGSLMPGVTKVFQVKGTILNAEDLPEDQGIICDVNTVAVEVNDLSDEDSAGFCIQKDVLTITTPGNPTTSKTITNPGITKGGGQMPATVPVVIPPTTKGGQPVYQAPKTVETPKTGPELFSLLGLIPTALGGHFLRKKSK